MTDVLEPPGGEEVEVELDLDPHRLEELRDRAGDVAPTDPAAFVRYLVYLGAAYLEAEALAAASDSPTDAYERVDRLLGAVQGHTAVVHFQYVESAREYAEEQRAHAAHERGAGAYEVLIERLEREIETREERIANLVRELEE